MDVFEDIMGCIASSVLTGLLEHEHGLRRGVDRQRAGPLHRAVAPARHAVAPPGVSEPQALRSTGEQGEEG